ncbi:hypothetical protein [Colwellia psychrerythraea]|uniref:Uncharacterized protein n=1 Tax=Colwellia psychrerythraea TaxID=28229 RepID=A0A099KN28_COLPS|nr:hypothetical protein [Colwellia psychrerythraea]KGJ92139.1 hypothetical protein ND2E_3032 [Colwellia psychrerythraea]
MTNAIFKIVIPTSILKSTINKALNKNTPSRSDFFYEVRNAFKKNLEDIFSKHGVRINSRDILGKVNYRKAPCQQELGRIIKFTGWDNDIRKELDFFFCARYGHDKSSIDAVNYIDRTPVSLPCLTSLSGVFSIGNIVISLENSDCDIQLTLGDGVYSTGYAYDISKRKKKSYFGLFGIWFEPKLIDAIISNKLSTHKETSDELDEINIGSNYPVIWIDRITGALYTCTCFNPYLDIDDDIIRFLPYGNSEPELTERVKAIKYIDNLCHFCNGGLPKIKYGNSMYYSSFLQYYLPYHKHLSRIKHGCDIYEGSEYRVIENELRVRFGFPKVGERWLSETMLYNIIVTLFPKEEVVHHYRGSELQRLELDIWLPNIKLGIEYQGEQHYKVVEHWGGKEGLKKRKENDKKKKMLCKELGYQLIEFKFSENLTEQLVKKRLSKFITD